MKIVTLHTFALDKEGVGGSLIVLPIDDHIFPIPVDSGIKVIRKYLKFLSMHLRFLLSFNKLRC